MQYFDIKNKEDLLQFLADKCDKIDAFTNPAKSAALFETICAYAYHIRANEEHATTFGLPRVKISAKVSTALPENFCYIVDKFGNLVGAISAGQVLNQNEIEHLHCNLLEE